MNLAVSPAPPRTLKMTLLLHTLESGTIAASVLEIPDCRVEAATKAESIAALETLLADRLKDTDIISLELPIPTANAQSPWTKLFGLFKDDPDFAEIAADIRAERDTDDDSEVDPSVYQRHA
jgi:hypothetical protein